MVKSKGKELLRDLKFYESYSKYREDLGRKETWEESVRDVMQMHRDKFKNNPDVFPYIDFAEEAYKEKLVLASQRNLQFRGPQIQRSNLRLFNCSSTYIDRPEVFGQVMYVLLAGCGVGYSVEQRFINNLPTIKHRKDSTITHSIEDSIEGWGVALDALMMSYFNGSEKIRFEYSQIRPEGAYISGGFRAPGPEPLKNSLEKIELLIEGRLKVSDRLTSLDCHEILCIASDAVLSAGVRRSAIICLFDKDDELMLNCKTGDWFYKKPHLARSNNSIKLVKGTFTKEEFNSYKDKIKQFGEPGIVLVDDDRFCTNPCAEISFIPINPRTGNSCWSFCNLNEVNGGMCIDEDTFYRACKAAAIIGTFQASYTDMPFLGSDTEELIRLEALLGVSITGLMDNPDILFNPEILRKGAEIVKQINKEVSSIIGINYTARATTIKPSGNASVLLGTSSGIHAAHSKRYFRVMQMNKNTEIGKYLKENNPELLEDSVWSANNSDYVVYIPIEEREGVITKENISDIEFLEKVKLVYENWIIPGTNKEVGYSNTITHNVSNTVSVQDWERVFDYIFDNQHSFCGLSFIAEIGDKIYKQSPFTKVMTFEEITKVYGESVIFASGLIVDSLHAFNNDLWDACSSAINRTIELTGDRYKVLLKKDIVLRIKKFSKNHFKGDLDKTINCLKDVHLFHKWNNISRKFKKIDFNQIDLKPSFTNVNELGAISCSGGSCEIVRI